MTDSKYYSERLMLLKRGKPRNVKCAVALKQMISTIRDDGYGPDKIVEYDRRGIMYRRMGCYIPPNRYYYICPDCKIWYDRKLRKIDDPWLSHDKTMKR